MDERVLCCVHFHLWRMSIWSILLTLQSNKYLRMRQTKWEIVDCHSVCATLCCNRRDRKSKCFISESRRGSFSPPAPNYDLELGESGSSKQAFKWVPKFTPRYLFAFAYLCIFLCDFPLLPVFYEIITFLIRLGVDRYVFFRADTDTDYYRSSRPITDILNRYTCLV